MNLIKVVAVRPSINRGRVRVSAVWRRAEQLVERANMPVPARDVHRRHAVRRYGVSHTVNMVVWVGDMPVSDVENVKIIRSSWSCAVLVLVQSKMNQQPRAVPAIMLACFLEQGGANMLQTIAVHATFPVISVHVVVHIEMIASFPYFWRRLGQKSGKKNMMIVSNQSVSQL